MNDLRELETSVAGTAFTAFSAAYAAFWLAELARPGFVSRFLSVHLFLLAAVVSGAWYAVRVERYRDRPLMQYACAFLLAPLAAYAMWRLGEGFGDGRLLAAALAAAVPPIVVPLLRSSSSS